MIIIYEQWKTFLCCLKVIADMLPSLGRSKVLKQLINRDVPRSLQALGGMTNALVACVLTFM